MTGGEYISLAIVIVEPISVLFLAWLTVAHYDRPAPPLSVRIGYIGIALGLTIHAAAHVELLIGEYKPPRSWSWLIFQASVNYTIWERYLRDRLKRPVWRKIA